ncbi:hypothetical protein AB0M46_32415 [Dactylosporangium sp. NPDC051485]|uniref:hypothetical protein n=1 Tax=Dactylosporangium sp. NPDC051485 TaxID=3154846 RepID=UPI003425A805
MNETQTSPAPTTITGGFAGDPAAALLVAGTSGCCGNPPTATLDLPEPAAASAPCCGTTAEAAAEASCCGSAAKADASAAGQGCCG